LTATIDLEKLLSAVSDETPAGEDMEYDPLFGEMERASEGKQEQQFGDTIIPAEEPEWRELRKKALLVVEQSKDLRAAIHLTHALVHTDGFAGLADGLALIKGYIEGFWGTLHPQLDPDDNNDPTLRINTLSNLCDAVGMLAGISRIPLVSSSVMGTYSYRDIQIASGNLQATERDNQELSQDHIDAAFRDCPVEETQQTLSNIRLAIDCVTAIEAKLIELVSIEQSPNLRALLELLKLLEKEVASRLGEESLAEEQDQAGAETQTQQQSTTSGAINNRDDVISALEKINQYYYKNEPSSPIPLLLDRAKRLVKMDFHEIVQDLAPGGVSQFDFLWKQEDS
jgi:type VI secretion system protein ImpA